MLGRLKKHFLSKPEPETVENPDELAELALHHGVNRGQIEAAKQRRRDNVGVLKNATKGDNIIQLENALINCEGYEDVSDVAAEAIIAGKNRLAYLKRVEEEGAAGAARVLADNYIADLRKRIPFADSDYYKNNTIEYSGHGNYKLPELKSRVTDLELANMIANKMEINDDEIKRIWIDGVISKVQSEYENFPSFDNNTKQNQKLILILDRVFGYGQTAGANKAKGAEGVSRKRGGKRRGVSRKGGVKVKRGGTRKRR